MPSAQTTIVTTGAGVLALHIVAAGLDGHPPAARRVIGCGVVTLGLSIGATYAPELAASMALLWGVSTVLISGRPVLTAITSTTKATNKNVSAKTPAPSAPILI